MEMRESYDADERFTPDEAVEILKRAVALEKDQFSAEDLFTMGHEAGVSREAVQRAIAEYREEQRRLEEERLWREQQLEAERLRYAQELEVERLRRKREQELQNREFTRFWYRLIQTIILIVVFFGIFAMMSTCMLGQFERTTRRMMQPPSWMTDPPAPRPIIVFPRGNPEPMPQEPWGR
ncbi:MAG: hypothetical protein K6U77_03350 [Armatimonadetes bacterium]|nr:hypothetical protein [Armatimonadota bacterium]